MHQITACLLAALLPGVAAAQERPDLSAILGDLDGTDVSAAGYIGIPPGLDWIYFVMKDGGRRFRVEMAVDRPTLEAVEQCSLGYDITSGCSATITGAIRLKDDYFQILVDNVSDLRAVE